MAQLPLFEIANEIREYVAELKEEGASQERVRELVVSSMDKTTLVAFQEVAMQIIADPNAGFSFTFSIYEALGGVNSVMIEEGLAPIHLNEMDFIREVLVSAIEEYAGESIDTVMKKMEQFKLDQQGGLQ